MPEADVRELFERFRGGDRGGFDEFIAAIALMQGGANLDMNSLITGMLLGGRGGFRGMDRSALFLLALTSCNNNNAAAQSTGTAPATNPLQQLLPLLLMMGGSCFGDGWDKSVEVVPRDRDEPSRKRA